MKKLTMVLVSLVILSTMAFSEGAGTTGAPFLKIPVGAKAGALGDAIVAAPLGAESIFWNIGALAFQEGLSFNASYQDWLADISTQYVGLSFTQGDLGTIGLGFVNLGMGEMDETTITDPDGTGETFSASDMALTLAYAKRFGEQIGFGLGLKYITQKIAEDSATAFTADIGMKFKLNDQMSIGLAAQNLFGEIGFTEKFPLPMILRGGVIFAATEALNVLAEIDYHADTGMKYSAGAEYVIKDMIAVRLGYKGGYSVDGITAGLGVKFSMINVDFSYGLVSEEALNNIMKFSLGLHF